MNIQSFLEYITAVDPTAVILSSSSFSGERTYTGTQYMQAIYGMTHHYYKKFGTGQRIALYGEATSDYMMHLFSVMCSGNVAIPMNPSFSIEQLKESLEIVEAECLLIDKEILAECENVKNCVDICVMEDSVSEYACFDYDLSEEEVNLMLLSSGTTGKSKAVKISGRNLFTALEYHLQIAQKKEKDVKRAMLLLPAHHIGGITLLLEALIYGYAVHISNAKRLLADIKSIKVERIIAVPAMIDTILKKAEKSEVIQNNLKQVENVLCVGAAERPELHRLLREREIDFGTYYGMTETAGEIAGIGPYRYGYCGKVFPFCEVKIVDGEICVKGNNVSSGYYKAPKEDEKTFKDGWIYTGDLGELDEEGYLKITGRKKNIIILSNGENVSPEEIEEKLLGHMLIQECMVYAKDEEICADIYLGEAELDEERKSMVYAYVKEINSHLTLSQKIKKVNILDTEIQKNSTGKIVRR